MEKAEAGREVHFLFETTDAESKRYYKEDDNIMVKIQDPSGNFLKKKIEDSLDGTYTVSFTPDTVGLLSVLITVNGQPLTGSPWSVQVSPHQYKHVFTFGSRGRRPGQFNSPQGISVNDNTDRIAVADWSNNRVQIFSGDGCYLREFAERLCYPRLVAFIKNGDLIVCHSGEISLFTESGQFIKQITNKHLKEAWRLSVAPDGNIIVYDWSDKNIKVFSPDGVELLHSFSAGCPKDIVYHEEMFFASSSLDHCIKVFNGEGVFLYDIGSEGTGDGQLRYPAGLAIDKCENLIVCDRGNRRLQVFTLDGQYVNTIGGIPTELKQPYGVAVSKTGRVYVTDFKANRVYVYQ